MICTFAEETPSADADTKALPVSTAVIFPSRSILTMESALLRHATGTEIGALALSRTVAVSVRTVPFSTARAPPSIVMVEILIGLLRFSVVWPEHPPRLPIDATANVADTARTIGIKRVRRPRQLDVITCP